MGEVSAIILAAGKGTRMKSALAKVLHPLLGRPVLAYAVAAARGAGVENPVVVVGHQGDEVRAAFAESGAAFVEQKVQRGTADAVASAKPALENFSGTLLILCGDVPLLTAHTLKKLLEAHRSSGSLVTVLSMIPEEPGAYGRLVRDDAGGLRAIVEARDAAPAELLIGEVNTGTYAVEAPWLWEAISSVGTDNSQGEFYLTDIVALAAKSGKASSVVIADPVEAMGINSRSQLAEACDYMRRKINEAMMENGVTLEDPATAWIEPGVEIAEDVAIAPQVRLTGATRIATGSRIDTGCVVNSSTLGEGVHLKPYCVLDGASLDKGAQAGPFAHLRPKARLEENARVGNFVELKNTVLGKGAKANHLTYLGDATIGEGSNIGAGTITCNYDGKSKFKTTIGARAFIGSNSSLVAPVMVGEDATVGAGSTITRDVEPGGLGLGRAKQRNIEGWKTRAAATWVKKEKE